MKVTTEEIESLRIIKLIAVEELKKPRDQYDPAVYTENVKIARGITTLGNLIKELEGLTT